MGRLIVRKVPASSLLEVLVSMVIIMIVFTLSIGVYSKVTNSGFSINDKIIQHQMQAIVTQTVENKAWGDEFYEVGDVSYNKAVSVYNNYTDLYLIKVEARKNGKVVGELKEIVKRSQNEN